MALLLTSASNVWLCLRLANEQRGCQSNCIIGLSITRQLEKNFNSIFFKSEVCSRDLDLNLRHCDKSGTGRMLNISWRWLVLMRQKYSDFQDGANLFQPSGTDCPDSQFKKAYNTSQWSSWYFVFPDPLLDKQQTKLWLNILFFAQHVSTVRPWSHASFNWAEFTFTRNESEFCLWY